MKIFNPAALLIALFTFCILTPSFATPMCMGPNKLKTSNATAFSVRILWTEGGAIETLHYRPLNATQWQSIRNVTSPFVLPGLTASTIYEYYISTDCPSYTGTPSVSRFTTMAMCMPAKNVAASNIKINGAQLDWTRGTGISSETIVIKEVGSSNSTRIMTPYGAPSYRLSGLKMNTQYEVVIESDCPISSQPTNNDGTVMSPPYRFSTAATASCADADFSIRATGYYELCAQWFPEGGVVSGYEICYKPLGSTDAPICRTLPKTQTNFFFVGKPNTVYEVELKTTCSDGTLYSQKDTAMTREMPKCSISATYGTITTSSISIGVTGDLANFKEILVYYKKASETRYTIVGFPVQSTITLTGLIPCMDYNIYVASSCDGGSASITNTNNFRTLALPCPQPINLRTTSPSTVVTPYCQVPDCIGIDWDYSFASSNPAYLATVRLEELVNGVWTFRTKVSDLPLNVRFFPFARLQYQSLAVGRNYRFSVIVNCDECIVVSASSTFSITPMPLIRSNNSKLLEAEVQKLKSELEVDEVLFAPNEAMNKITPSSILTITPNPTSDNMVVILPNDTFEQLSIFNIEGRMVKQISLKNRSMSQRIDCSDLSNGMYFITARDSNAQTVNTRFVKQ